jgi:hypothetical protein
MRFLRNISRAIRYNRKKHVPVEEFIGGVEDRWQKTLDQNSRRWLLSNPTHVDLLHQMLTGQLVSGNQKFDSGIFLLFLEKMIFSYSSNVTLSDIQREKEFIDILDKFHESHPDAATIIGYAFNAFMKSK